ncbi:hypothetical protein DSO57_1006582 [Entomophthora muscae]|uniref:Uncharacterized protein n=1 Tax=Entomophthora muscae TaxID=34485 RepID=A0ACC2TVG1_9FUNG|nr:hypothetical protein DSO57_1006582 [Entomophthora muscae]
MSNNSRESNSPSQDYGSDSVRGIKSPVTYDNCTFQCGEKEVTFTYGTDVYNLPKSLVEFIHKSSHNKCAHKSKNDQQASPPHQQSNSSNDDELNHNHALFSSDIDCLKLSSTDDRYDGKAGFSECVATSLITPSQEIISLINDSIAK